ncbi:nuclear transport factor 2 family protein [Actinoallomurus sp. NPDC050550]|uniref:nuclear transport factor 2 family protein n=1 Tax=Actinoallomurus sp. NPDC050550 TaxID=3154937 RepID=UPI0033F5AD3F
MPTSTGPLQVFERFRDRVLAGEWGAWTDHSDDITIELPCAPPGSPRRFHGGAEFAAHTEASRAAMPVRFEEFRDVVVHETTDPEVIVVEYTMAGTVTTTGRSASAPFVLVLRVRDGRVLLWREYQNVLAIAEALGTVDALLAGVGGRPVPPEPANSPAPAPGATSRPGIASGPGTESGPGAAVYDRIRRAVLDGSPDDYADLYAADAVLKFPFTAPGFPRSLHGREEIRAHLRAAFGRAVRIEEFRDVVVHETTDPDVIVAEHAIVGAATASGLPCSIANLLVLTIRDGHIVHQRDYLDVLGAAVAAGRLPASR